MFPTCILYKSRPPRYINSPQMYIWWPKVASFIFFIFWSVQDNIATGNQLITGQIRRIFYKQRIVKACCWPVGNWIFISKCFFSIMNNELDLFQWFINNQEQNNGKHALFLLFLYYMKKRKHKKQSIKCQNFSMRYAHYRKRWWGKELLFTPMYTQTYCISTL